MSDEEIDFCYIIKDFKYQDYKGCFKFYLNYLGFGMMNTWPEYDSNYTSNMRLLSNCFAAISILTILIILNM